MLVVLVVEKASKQSYCSKNRRLALKQTTWSPLKKKKKRKERERKQTLATPSGGQVEYTTRAPLSVSKIGTWILILTSGRPLLHNAVFTMIFVLLFFPGGERKILVQSTPYASPSHLVHENLVSEFSWGKSHAVRQSMMLKTQSLKNKPK